MGKIRYILAMVRNALIASGMVLGRAEPVQCGVRLQTQTASIVQGPFQEEERSAASQVDAPEAKGLEAVVTVDLAKQTVTYVANGERLEAKLKSPLRSVTLLGYLMNGALIDVAPIDIERSR